MRVYDCTIRRINKVYVVTRVIDGKTREYEDKAEALKFLRERKYTFYFIYPEIKEKKEKNNLTPEEKRI